MRKITGKEAFELLQQSEMYMIEDGNNAIVYGSPDDDDSGTYSLDLSYENEDGHFDYSFWWNENDEIEILDNAIILKSMKEEMIGIKLLEVATLP